MKALGMLFQLCGSTETSKYSTSRLDGSKRRSRSSEPDLPRYWRRYANSAPKRILYSSPSGCSVKKRLRWWINRAFVAGPVGGGENAGFNEYKSPDCLN